jgi:hypothetical protein
MIRIKIFIHSILLFLKSILFEIQFLSKKKDLVPYTPYQTAKIWKREIDILGPKSVNKKLLITAFRNPTWIEWGIYCAVMAKKFGFDSDILVDSSEITKFYGNNLKFFEKVKEIKGINIIELDKVITENKLNQNWVDAASEWVNVALAYDFHVEETDIIDESEKYSAFAKFYIQRTAKLASALEILLNENTYYKSICYSGLIGESKVLLDVLMKYEVSTVCAEGWGWRPGHMIYNLNAPALEYNSLGWMKAQGEWDEKKENEINALIEFIDFNSKDEEWLKNYYRIQKDKITDDLPDKVKLFVSDEKPLFILATNVIGDSSTLRRESIFVSQKEWLREVIEWFKTRPDLKLIIRAHPGEIWMGNKCIQYLGEYSEEISNGLSNVLVIKGSEKVNSFSLIPFAKLGLVWLSSIGADFVCRGLPCVVAAIPKYSGLDIVEEPKSKEEYFNLLENSISQSIKPNNSQILNSKRYLHMVFKGFSFESQGRSYRAMSNLINNMHNQEEHDKFYKILFGLETPPELMN